MMEPRRRNYDHIEIKVFLKKENLEKIQMLDGRIQMHELGQSRYPNIQNSLVLEKGIYLKSYI
jgi:hypothetical protein